MPRQPAGGVDRAQSESSLTVSGALGHCGILGACFGPVAGVLTLLLIAAILTPWKTDAAQAGMILTVGLPLALIISLPSGFLAGVVYAAFGNRFGAILAGLAAGTATPMGLSAWQGLFRWSRAAQLDAFSLIILAFPPLFMLWVHSNAVRRDRGSTARLMTEEIERSPLAYWAPRQRAVFGAVIAFVGTAAISYGWSRIGLGL